MPHPIEQPSRRDPTNRLPSYLQPTISVDAQRTLDAIDRQGYRQPATPAVGITRLSIPFEDVFFFALKFFMAQVIIGTPFVVLIWFAFLR